MMTRNLLFTFAFVLAAGLAPYARGAGDNSRQISIDKPYLNFPVKNGGPMRRVSVTVDGHVVRDFDIELADGQPDWWAFLDATPFAGQTVTIQANGLPENSPGLSSIDQTAGIKDAGDLYHEPLRPQFHFTSRRGWLNDPNGLVFSHGEYHLFYQHNPYGWNAANMHWGHAVSRDLVHWKELPVALYPEGHGDDIWSGSAVVDWDNTTGFKTGAEPPLVAMFTVAGRQFNQQIAYSNDRGRTWTTYPTPVLDHIAAQNRDPKVTWFAPQKKWVMALYLDHNDYALFSSPDLKSWQKTCDINLPGDAECPNFFSIPLDGDTNNLRWVFYGASGIYLTGRFDGGKFTAETPPQRLENGNCWYASQMYSDIPSRDGRRILVPWGRLPDGDIFRGMPFNQMMGLPVELSLRSGRSGASLAVEPVKELASLRHKTNTFKQQKISAGANLLTGINGELFEIEAELAVGDAKEINLNLRGVPVAYNVTAQKISCLGCQAALPVKDGKISLHIFVDREAVDIFGGDGLLYMPMAAKMATDDKSLSLSCTGGDAGIVRLKVYELKSAW